MLAGIKLNFFYGTTKTIRTIEMTQSSSPDTAITTTATTTTYLSKQNPHPRDADIHFDEGPHKYTIQSVTPETEFTSVTTLVHQHFEHFDAKKVIAGMMRNQKKWNDPIANAKYYGKTAEEIEQAWSKAGQEAAAKGTAMHHKIECFYNQPQSPATDDGDTTPEFKYFLNFQRDFAETLRPYRTEWTVFHEEARIAGSIDMVYMHQQSKLKKEKTSCFLFFFSISFFSIFDFIHCVFHIFTFTTTTTRHTRHQ